MCDDAVVIKRFVNTPTLLELYQEEHPGEGLGVETAHVEALSNEYNQVTGNESYSLYKTLFQHLPSPTLDSRTGTEGFMEWVGETLKKLIDSVKVFFKWLWSLVSSKQKGLELKTDKLKADLKKHGVKSKPSAYPKTVIDLWGSPKSLPPSLAWVDGKLNNVKDRIGHCKDYGKALKTFLEGVKGHFQPGSVYSAGDAVTKAQAVLIKDTAKAFTGGAIGKEVPFVGTGTVSVSKTGKVTFTVDTKLASLGAKVSGEFTTTLAEAEHVVKTTDEVLSEIESLNQEFAALEGEIIKDVELLLKNAVPGGEGHGKNAVGEVVKGIQSTIGDFMATVKHLEQYCFKPVTVATQLVNSAIAH